MPGLCLLDIGGAPYIGYNIMPPKALFNIFDFFSKTTNNALMHGDIFRRVVPLVAFCEAKHANGVMLGLTLT